MSAQRNAYRLLARWGDAKALQRSPGAYVRRRARSTALGYVARILRRVIRP